MTMAFGSGLVLGFVQVLIQWRALEVGPVLRNQRNDQVHAEERNRQARGHVDTEGNAIASLLPITVRGRELLDDNNRYTVPIPVGAVDEGINSKLLVVQWFLSELSNDINGPAAAPAEPASSSTGSPRRGYISRQILHELSSLQTTSVAKHTKRLCEHSNTKSVSFDKSLGKIEL